jgi:hypothetical protein
MHHYRCQNVYILATASERIVDTFEFFPHNYQMPQLSSTDILIMAAKDMTDALQNPHPEVTFARVGDDTILALAESSNQILNRDKRDHRQQFTHKTSPMRHYLRGWSHLEHSVHHLRGCPLAHRDSLPATFPEKTSAAWTQPTWPSPSETTIGLGST